MYFLLDANIPAGYYLPISLNSQKEKLRIQAIFSYLKKNKKNNFIYIPNFCIAETFNVFAKYSFSSWNNHLKRKKTKTIDTRTYQKIAKKFEKDIHNGNFLYHYELNRYHILNAGFICPIDHHYQYSKGNNIKPMGTFDHLIIAMGIELTRIHGKDNVCILSSDTRLTNILKLCKKGISKSVIDRLKLSDITTRVRGVEFNKNIFPNYLNIKTCSDKDLKIIFGENFIIKK